MVKKQIKILVVDDEPQYIRAIQVNLQARGYAVISASNGTQALELAAGESPDLVMLDIRMPDFDGYEVCRRIREFSIVPIIMLTALAETADKIKGLEAGADDYVTKPFSSGELMARVHSALRRVEMDEQNVAKPSVFQVGTLIIDFGKHAVFVDDHPVKLTPTEFRLLSEMAKQAGKVLVPSYLLERVWGAGYEGDDHLVWQAIHRLRRKIERDPENPQYILTQPGAGYYLATL
jgi:DNA-binding response OmpR family regulator